MISGFCWLGMLLGLLIDWNVLGRPHYPSMEASQSIAYISDVGADKLKPLFIAGSCTTTIFLDISFLSERWLRHRGRLAANISTTEKVLSWLSMFFALVGTAGLILLSIFDTLHHKTLHDLFLLLFIVGYVVSAIFICWEYQRLGASTFSPPLSTCLTDLFRISRAPYPSLLLLDQALFHSRGNHPRGCLRRLQLPQSMECRRYPGMGNCLHLHFLRLLILHRFAPGRANQAWSAVSHRGTSDSDADGGE